MTTRELENLLTQWLIDAGSWAFEALVLVGITSAALFVFVGIPLIVLIDRRLHPRS